MIARLAAFAWLLLVWVALLGGVSPVGAVMGALLSAALLTYFRPLSTLGEALAFRPHHAVSFLAYFAVLFIKANVQVARAVLNPARVRGRRAVVAVPIVGASELTTLVLANAVCLTPGTFVLEIRHAPETLYVHVLQLTTARDLRRGILEMERRIVLAIGPAEAVARVQTLMARVAADTADEGRHVSWRP